MTTYLIYLVIALQLADIVTTYLSLRAKKGTESNGFIAAIMGSIGVLPALILLKGAFIAFLLYFAPLIQLEVLSVLALGYCWVIFNNIKVLKKS